MYLGNSKKISKIVEKENEMYKTIKLQPEIKINDNGKITDIETRICYKNKEYKI